MNEARDSILKRLRNGSVELTGMIPPATTPPSQQWSRQQRIEQFCSRMQQVRAEVRIVPRAEWVRELKELVREKKIPNLLYAPDGPLGKAIEVNWRDEGLPELVTHGQSVETWKEMLFFDTSAAITSTRGGIAETGSLILWPTPEEPRTYSLVPPLHIAILDSEKLYTDFAEAIENEHWEQGLPTNVVLVSGPSKSADIEQTLAYGVHGPTELVVLLLT